MAKRGGGQKKRTVGPFIFPHSLLMIGLPSFRPCGRWNRYQQNVEVVKERNRANERALRTKALHSRSPVKNKVLGSSSTNGQFAILIRPVVAHSAC